MPLVVSSCSGCCLLVRGRDVTSLVKIILCFKFVNQRTYRARKKLPVS
jgi:hypothetical protein